MCNELPLKDASLDTEIPVLSEEDIDWLEDISVAVLNIKKENKDNGSI